MASAVVRRKTRVIDLDLSAYFDTIIQSILLVKVARRVADDKVFKLLKVMVMLVENGGRGIPQTRRRRGSSI